MGHRQGSSVAAVGLLTGSALSEAGTQYIIDQYWPQNNTFHSTAISSHAKQVQNSSTIHITKIKLKHPNNDVIMDKITR